MSSANNPFPDAAARFAENEAKRVVREARAEEILIREINARIGRWVSGPFHTIQRVPEDAVPAIERIIVLLEEKSFDVEPKKEHEHSKDGGGWYWTLEIKSNEEACMTKTQTSTSKEGAE